MTTDIDVVFCRKLLSMIHKDVRQHFPAIRLRQDAWTYRYGRDNWEFHGPDGFHWHGRAANSYDARHKGWSAFLKSKKVSGYE